MTLPLNRLNEFQNPTDAARFNMIEQQIRPWNVDDAAVLATLRNVKRERYVPAAYKAMTFMDMEIPLLTEAAAKERPDCCMLPPKIEARVLANLQVQRQERILEVGAGSGYMAALLAALGREVITLDIAADMAQLAGENLKNNGVSNVQVVHGDGSVNIPSGGFDVIVLSGSVAEIPSALVAALNNGGRLMACVGQGPAQQMQLVSKINNKIEVTKPWDFNLPRLQGFPVPSSFVF